MTTTARPRPTLADQLERLTPRFDELTQRARLGTRSVREFEELEEIAQLLARDLVAPFRGPRPVNPPLRISADGLQAAW